MTPTLTKAVPFQLDIETTMLRELVAAVRPAVSGHVIIPALAGVRIEATGDCLTISATDLQVHARIRQPGPGGQGTVVLAARILEQILAKMPDGKLTLRTEDDRVVVKSGRSRYRLRAYDALDFPEPAKVDAVGELTVPAAAFATALGQIAPMTAAQTESRVALTGVHMEAQGSVLTLAATDSYVLAAKPIPLVAGTKDAAVLIPTPSLELLAKLLAAEGDGDVTLRFGESQAVVETERFTLVTRLIESKFPDWRQLLPSLESMTSGFDVDRAALMDAVAQASIVRSTKKLTPLRIVGRGGVMLVVTQTDGDEAEIELETEWFGEPYTVGVTPEFLLRCLRSITGETVRLRFIDAARPLRILGDEEDHVSLLMPVRLWT